MEHQISTTRSISVEAWHKLALEGNEIPIQICLNGDSMRPLIRRQRDRVTIIPLKRPLRRGDIVLFADAAGRYVVHRVQKEKNGFVTTIGDHCIQSDLPLRREQIWGLVIKVTRGKRVLRLDCASARLWGRIWMRLLPIRRIYIKIRNVRKGE